MFFADFDHYIPKTNCPQPSALGRSESPGQAQKVQKMGRGQPKGTKFITVGLLFKLLYFIRLK